MKRKVESPEEKGGQFDCNMKLRGAGTSLRARHALLKEEPSVMPYCTGREKMCTEMQLAAMLCGEVGSESDRCKHRPSKATRRARDV